MAVSVTTFRTRFPEFEDVTDSRIELFISDAELLVDQDKWDRLYDLGVAYLAAHELSISIEQDESEGAGATAAGPIIHETVGPLIEKRAVLAMDLSDGEARLASTSYGLKWLELRKQIPTVGYMVISDATYTNAGLR